MEAIHKTIISIILAITCLESYSQVPVFSKSHLQSQNWKVMLEDDLVHPFLFYKFQSDTVYLFIRPEIYVGDGPYYLSDTPDTTFVTSKVGVKTQGRYLVCRIHKEANVLNVMHCVSCCGNWYKITTRFGNLYSPVSARFLPTNEFLLE